jgi:SAM-dependent methyltransferase
MDCLCSVMTEQPVQSICWIFRHSNSYRDANRRSNKHVPVVKKLIFLRAMGMRYALFKLHSLLVPHRLRFARYMGAFTGVGIEIGGPSSLFRSEGLLPVYDAAERIDNVTFANNTRWEGNVRAGTTFLFNPTKDPGTQYIQEGGELCSLPNSPYDFLLSCHMLEHTANPLRVLSNWRRLLKTNGHFLLVLPHKDGSFDHRRSVTTLAHLLDDFEKNIGEDDDTHFSEILSMHDLQRDPEQNSAIDFAEWILNNNVNRGAHHHVFDVALSVHMLTEARFQIVAVEAVMPFHIFVLAYKPEDQRAIENERFLLLNSRVYQESPFRSDRLQDVRGGPVPG